jgi:hypothetical protein
VPGFHIRGSQHVKGGKGGGVVKRYVKETHTKLTAIITSFINQRHCTVNPRSLCTSSLAWGWISPFVASYSQVFPFSSKLYIITPILFNDTIWDAGRKFWKSFYYCVRVALFSHKRWFNDRVTATSVIHIQRNDSTKITVKFVFHFLSSGLFLMSWQK